jgi:hypothetical protein
VPQAGGLGRGGQVLGLRSFFLGREVLPEVRDAERSVASGEGGGEALDVVEVRTYDLRARVGQGARLGRVRVAGDGPDTETAFGIVEDRPGQSTSLGSGRAEDGDHFGIGHAKSLSA